MSDFKPSDSDLTFCPVIVCRRRRFEVALSKRQQLILRYLVAQAGRPVREEDLVQMAYGIFDRASSTKPVREEIGAIELLLSSIVGANAIHIGPDRSYQLENRNFGFSFPTDPL